MATVGSRKDRSARAWWASHRARLHRGLRPLRSEGEAGGRTEESRAESCCWAPEAPPDPPLPVGLVDWACCAAWAAWRAERRSMGGCGERKD